MGKMWVSGVTAAMVALEFLDVGMNTVNKAAMSKGLSHFIIVLYSNFLGFFILFLSSLIFYRKRSAPLLTWSIICRIFILGAVSCSGQMFTYVGISYSSPTLASAMSDLTPAFTFILAIISRMERLDLRTKSSLAKCIGTVVLITGGLVVTLYKGLPITTYKLLNLLRPSNWVIGGLFLAAHSLVHALYYIIQTWIIRDYPAEIMVTLMNCTVVTILSAIVTFIAEKESSAWRISPDIELIAILYSAIFAVTLRTLVHMWACHRKGPVYTSMFKPLGMVIAVFMGVCFLGDALYVGSVIGAVIIACGFYAVIWGKGQEARSDSFEQSCTKAPLLQQQSTNG